MTMVTVAPTARSPSEQETVPEEWLQVPALVVAETKLVPAGNGSATVTSLAASGPPLETLSV